MTNPYTATNSTANMQSSSHTAVSLSSHSNEIELKLQRIEADFRRQREQARREAELARERLRLVQEDAASRRNTLEDWQTKLERVQIHEDSRREMRKLHGEVERLAKEVRDNLDEM
jgi:hypothetical protein